MTTYAGQYGPETLLDGAGRPLRLVNVIVLGADGVTPAVLYTSRTKTATTPSNTVQTSSDGNLSFFADPGAYRLRWTVAGVTHTLDVEVSQDFVDQGGAVRSVNGRTGVVTLAAADVGAVPQSEVGVSVAQLVGGKVPSGQIPSLSWVRSHAVATQAAMLALTGVAAGEDLALRQDGAGTFLLTGADPSQLASWTLLPSPTDAVASVNGRTGAVVLAAADVGADASGAAATVQGNLTTHASSTSNPHATTAAQTGAPNVVVHGATAGTARPAGATLVLWIGSVAPTNAATNDWWWDTSVELSKRWSGTAWKASGSAAYKPKVTLASLGSGPLYLPHRIGANIAPENTMPALRAMMGLGLQTLNIDCMILADGGLGVMHDTTLDRTTTSTGSSLVQTALSWQNLTVDAPAWLGGTWPNTSPPLLSEVLNAAAGNAVLVLETMTDPTAAPLKAELDRRGLKDSVIVGSRSLTALSALAAAGYRCLMLADDNSTTAAAVTAAGYTDVGFLGSSVTAAQLDPYIAAGLNVHIYTLTRQSNVAKFAGKAVYMFHCDEPLYCSGQTSAYRGTTDRFAAGTWDHGMVPSVGNQPVTAGQDFAGWNGPENTGGLSNRGYFTSGRWGMSNTGAVLQGWACPYASAGGSGSITFTVTFDAISVDTARYAMIYFACPDDNSFLHTNLQADDNGYYALIRGNGGLELYKIVNGVQTQIGSTVTTAAVGNGGTITVRASWTPTTVTWERTSGTTGVVGPVTDSSFRGGYFHLGMTNNSGAGNIKISFGGITVA